MNFLQFLDSIITVLLKCHVGPSPKSLFSWCFKQLVVFKQWCLLIRKQHSYSHQQKLFVCYLLCMTVTWIEIILYSVSQILLFAFCHLPKICTKLVCRVFFFVWAFRHPELQHLSILTASNQKDLYYFFGFGIFNDNHITYLKQA